MPENNKLAFATRAVHSGYDSADSHGALNPPIYMTSTFCSIPWSRVPSDFLVKVQVIFMVVSRIRRKTSLKNV